MISISSIVAGRFLPLFSAGKNALRLALRAPSQLTTEPITDCKVCRIPTGFGLVDWLDRTHRHRETLPSHVYEPRSWLVEWSGVPLIKQYHGLSLEPVSQTCCHFRDLRPGGGGESATADSGLNAFSITFQVYHEYFFLARSQGYFSAGYRSALIRPN